MSKLVRSERIKPILRPASDIDPDKVRNDGEALRSEQNPQGRQMYEDVSTPKRDADFYDENNRSLAAAAMEKRSLAVSLGRDVEALLNRDSEVVESIFRDAIDKASNTLAKAGK